ncbi:Fc.00g067780.m01.CDS01 [Cosmosporella sp. VM-42]
MSSSPSSGVEIRDHPTKRRGLFATQPFAPGAVILSFTPLLLIPTLTHIQRVCSHCLKPGTPRACSRCRQAYYCNGTCQQSGWAAGHGKECKALKKVGRGLPTPIRAVVQALLIGDIEDGLSELESNLHAWEEGSEHWSDIQMMAMAASNFAGFGTSDREVRRALELLCKVQTNAFHRHETDLGQIGIFVEPTLAMANHSCLPNALVQFMGREAILRAETPIKVGDEIEISYTDYTFPLPKRQDVLSSYAFLCQCPRCKDDLGIYEACAKSPNIDLNRQGLVSDLSKLRHHPAATERFPSLHARMNGIAAVTVVDSAALPEPLPERFEALETQVEQCSALISEELWAVAPVPQVLTEISIYYAEDGNFVSALAIACLIATHCDPYRYVAPFHPVRIKGLFRIAKLLANTAAETATLSNSVKLMSAKGDFKQKALETVRGIDQVSLCEMILIMILKSIPENYGTEWELFTPTTSMLDDIEELRGREEELRLINAWKKGPETQNKRAFFEFAVLKQVDALASLGRLVLKEDFDPLEFNV